MPKLEITEVQIDNYNETNNTLTKFESGLNIICGPNEAGKTTLMSFIKGIFLREKNDAKGYLKFSCRGNDTQLQAGKNMVKENAPFLENISPHGYKTGFIIDLDDLIRAKKADAQELVNTIKDSSGNAVNIKENCYHDFIYDKKQAFYLTGTDKASKSFLQQFEKLRDIESQIDKLQKKEEEYNTVCNDIGALQKDIELAETKCAFAQAMIEKIEKQKKLKELKNISINNKLLENRTEFENIRERFGALNSAKSKLENLNQKLIECDNSFSAKYNELQRLEVIDKDKIISFELSPDKLRDSKKIIEREKDIKSVKSTLDDKINDSKNNLNKISVRKNTVKSKLDSVQINNIEEYTKDKIMLEKYQEQYSELLEKYRHADTNSDGNKQNNLTIFILLFAGILCASLGSLILYFSSPVKYMFIALVLVSIAGINTCVMERLKTPKNSLKNKILKEIEINKSAVIRICNKYEFEYSNENDFGVQTNCIIKEMIDKISVYNSLSEELKTLSEDYEEESLKLENLQNEIEKENNEYIAIQKAKENFLKEVSVSNLGDFQEIYEYIRELKDIYSEMETASAEISEINKNTEDFVQKLNSFIKSSNLEEILPVNKYDDFEKTLDAVRGLVDKSLENNKLYTEISGDIENLNDTMSKYPDNIKEELKDADENVYEELQSQLKNRQEQKGMLLRSKELLEEVSGLIELKTERNTEINRLKSALKQLVVKEIVYSVIKNSKEKFNEIQPNLVSAKKFLSKITEDKYNDIDFEGGSIRGENKGDKDWDKLSRGTKEQLYLALRLGFADNYSKDRDGNPNGIPNLPLIIDDAFVNFDPQRTSAVLECLEEFSKTNQVLFFTCHGKNIRKILDDRKIKYNNIDI